MTDTAPESRSFEGLSADTQRVAPHLEYQKHREDQRDKIQKEHNDKMMLIVTAIGVFVGIVSIAVGIWFGRDTSENQKRSLDAQIQAMVLEQRPYVRTEFTGYRDERMEFWLGGLLKTVTYVAPVMHVKMKTFGRTPALNIVVKGECEAHADTKEILGQVFDEEQPPNDLVGSLFPGEEHEVFCKVVFDKFKQSQTIDGVKFKGKISYQDFSKHYYETPFCFTYDLSKEKNNPSGMDCGIVAAPQ